MRASDGSGTGSTAARSASMPDSAASISTGVTHRPRQGRGRGARARSVARISAGSTAAFSFDRTEAAYSITDTPTRSALRCRGIGGGAPRTGYARRWTSQAPSIRPTPRRSDRPVTGATASTCIGCAAKSSPATAAASAPSPHS